MSPIDNGGDSVEVDSVPISVAASTAVVRVPCGPGITSST